MWAVIQPDGETELRLGAPSLKAAQDAVGGCLEPVRAPGGELVLCWEDATMVVGKPPVNQWVRDNLGIVILGAVVVMDEKTAEGW